MDADAILEIAVTITLVILSISFLLTVLRIILGPTLPDRILAIDMLVGVAIGFIAVIGIKTGYALYVDVAISLGLVGFLATVAFARFVLSRGKTDEDKPRRALSRPGAPEPGAPRPARKPAENTGGEKQ